MTGTTGQVAAPHVTARAGAIEMQNGRIGWYVVGALVVGALTLPLAWQIDDVRQVVLAELTVLVCYVGIVRSVVNGPRLVQLLFWSFCGCWLGVAPLYQLAVRQFAWNDYVLITLRNDIVFAQLMSLCSLLSFLLGSLLRQGRHASSRDINVVRLRRATSVWVTVGCMLLPAAVVFSGGIAGLFASRTARASVIHNGGSGVGVGALVILPAAVATVSAYFALRGLSCEARKKPLLQWRASWIALSLIGLLLVVLVANPIANTRFISLAAISACILAVYRVTTHRRGLYFVSVAVFAFLFVYPIADGFRRVVEVDSFRTFSFADWASADFDGFQQWVNTVSYVDGHGHSLGRFTLSALLFFAPRVLWPSKELPASITVAECRGYDFTNLSLPFPAEMFLEFGLVGMVIVMCAFGWVWERLDRVWLHSPDSVLAMMVPIVATQQLGMFRGPMGAQIPVAGAVLVLAGVTVWWTRSGGAGPRSDGSRRTTLSADRQNGNVSS